MPFTQLPRETRMPINNRTATRGAWESETLRVYIADTINWSTHIELRIEKANEVFYRSKRNVAFNVKFSVKFGIFKSAILPVLLYGLNCAYQSRTDQRKLENYQRRVLKWVCGPHRGDYRAQLRQLNVLPLPLFIQLILFCSF